MSEVQKIILDTDPGVDDAMAFFQAIGDPLIDLVGMTSVFGNVSVKTATRNAFWLCNIAGKTIPVAQGAAHPLGESTYEPETMVHGVEGFGDIPPVPVTGTLEKLPAAEFLAKTCADNPGEITICAIGPLTNLALALRHDPAIVQNVKRVVLMGGAYNAPGNITPHAEANVFHDPKAAAEVFAADWEIIMVGLDVTDQILCSDQDFAKIKEIAPVAGGFIQDMSHFYLNFYRSVSQFEGCSLHDPAAVIACAYPEYFTMVDAHIDVIIDGDAFGNTIDAKNAGAVPVKVCTDVQIDVVKQHFINTFKVLD